MRGRSIHDLTRDYLDAERLARNLNLDSAARQRLIAYQRFVERNGHRLGPFPGTLREVALAEPADSLARADILGELNENRWLLNREWFLRLHVPPTEPNPALRRTIFTGTPAKAVTYLERGGGPHALAVCVAERRVYDLATGKQLRDPVEPADEGKATSLTSHGRHPDGLWDQTSFFSKGHTAEVTAVAFSADGRHALSGSADRTLRWWDLRSEVCLRTLLGHAGIVRAVALSRDGRYALSSGDDGTLRWWDLQESARLPTGEGHRDGVRAVALSSDARHALSGARDRTLRWWCLEDGRCLHSLEGHQGEVTAVALSADGRRALSGSTDGTMRWWDIERGRSLGAFERTAGPIWSVALSADGRRALSGSTDGTLRWWDLETERCLHNLQGHADTVWSVALSADGRRALSGSTDRTLRWWDLAKGECLRVLQEHTGEVTAVALSKDGKHALSGGWDHTLRWWDLCTGCPLAVFPCENGVKGVALAPASRGPIVAAGFPDGQVQFFCIMNS